MCGTGLLTEDCATDHYAPTFGLRCTGTGQWSGPCPVCHGVHCFSLTARNGQLLWHCNRQPACPQETLQDTLAARLPGCIPVHRRTRATRPRSDRETLRQLTELLDKPVNGNAYRLQAAMLLLDLDAKSAAERLKIPERTLRRLLCP